MKVETIKKLGIKSHGELEKYCIEQIKECCYSGDKEADHVNADNILNAFLTALGFKKLVREFDKVEKWYA